MSLWAFLRLLCAFMALWVFVSHFRLMKHCDPDAPWCHRKRKPLRRSCHAARRFAVDLPDLGPDPACPAEARFCVVPKPAHISVQDGGDFTLSSETRIYASSYRTRAMVEQLQILLRCDLGLRVNETSSGWTPNAIHVDYDRHIAAEGYELHVSLSGMRVVVSAVAGAFYAFQTLKQLLPLRAFSHSAAHAADVAWRVPAVEIKDWPRYPWRAFMFDSARHFYDVDHIKHLLDLMAMHKLNIFHWHLTDDQGWRVEILKHPELAQFGGRRGPTINPREAEPDFPTYNGTAYDKPQYYSQSDVREVVAYAEDLFITVVPEIDVPAHAAALIVAARSAAPPVRLGTVRLAEGCAYPGGADALRTAPNCMGGTHGIVLPTDEALAYLKSVLAEVCDLFPGGFVHLGGDEAIKIREAAYGSEEGRQLAAQLGLAHSAQLQGYLLDQLGDFLHQQNRKVLAWDDAFMNPLTAVRRNTHMMLVWWREFAWEANFDSVTRVGYPVIAAPTSKSYLDCYQMQPHRDSLYEVQANHVLLKDAFDLGALDHGRIVGVEGLLWTETMTSWDVVEYQLFPRLLGIAEAAWVPRERRADWPRFLEAVQYHKGRLHSRGVKYYNGTYTGA